MATTLSYFCELMEGEENKLTTFSTCTTVEPPITDTPNSGHPPNNGRQLMYQLLFPLTQYIYSSRIVDNLRIPDNGQVSRTERHFPIEAHLLERTRGGVL